MSRGISLIKTILEAEEETKRHKEEGECVYSKNQEQQKVDSEILL